MVRTVSRMMCALAAIVFWTVAAHAATYYVATGGNDNDPGSETQPFATLQKAANIAVGGDTIIVRPGTYVGAKFSVSGSAENPIVVTGEPGAIIQSPSAANANGDNIWIRDASYITIEGFEIRNAPRAGIAVQGEPAPDEVHGVVIRNNNVHDNQRWGIFTGYAEGVLIENNICAASAQEHGIYVSNSADNPVIRLNTCHDNFLAGIQINADPALDGDGIITNALVDSNTIFSNGVGGAAGINLASVVNSLISNNLLYDNHATGIVGWDDEAGVQFGTHNNRFFNNTVVMAEDGRFALSLLNGSFNNAVHNNILMHLGARGSIEIDSGSEEGLFSDFNIVVAPFSVDENFISLASWQARAHDANSFFAFPTDIFVNFAADNYDLPEGSPAVDFGRSVTGVNADILGRPRPVGRSFDIGAYEYTPPVPDNQAPMANAGADQVVDPGDIVGLNGSNSSDPDNDTLTYSWVQTIGVEVVLMGANSSTPTFVAPNVTVDAQLTFQLTVSDGRGGAATDTVRVTIVAPPPPPAITVLKPIGGEIWKVGKKRKIQFVADAGVTGNVRIELSRDGGATFETLFGSIPVSRGKKNWKVSGQATTQAIIRITSLSDGRITGRSPNVFTIQ